MPTKQPTLDDVAAAAGVSRAAASRALNRRAGVTIEVRERVVAAADALGYRPNRSARRLAGGGSSVLGLVLGADGLERRPWMVALLQALARAADRQGQGLMTVVDSATPSQTIRNLISDGLVEGVLVRAGAVDAPWVEELVDAGLPAVLIGHHVRHPDVPTVDSENVEASAALVGAMFDAGAERVAMITGHREAMDAGRRFEGYQNAHLRRGRTIDPALTFDGDFTPEGGYRLADAVVAAGADGVFCANDDTALGLLHRLNERDVSTPEQMMVAGFDGTLADDPMALRFLGPRVELATARVDYDRVAEMAIESLRMLVVGMELPAERLAEPTVILGSTIRAPLPSCTLSRADREDRV